MKGQWIGNFSGSSSGQVIVNIDESPSFYQGVVYLHESEAGLPSALAGVVTTDKKTSFECRAIVFPINPRTRRPDIWANIKADYDATVNFSTYADIKGSWDDETLNLSWTTDIGVVGNAVLPRSKAAEPSELVPENKTWESFKAYVAGLEGKRYLFRGQSTQRRLRTSFHRTGRVDLMRFIREDIRTLHQYLSARTRHVFNLDIGNENGAFFNLVQHHGYPTPLLDWTYSPYVAAFFAYRHISRDKASTADQEDKVRILVFDQAKWRATLPQMLVVESPWLHLSIGEFLAIENERMIPQQAASLVTNIDDIESYIAAFETLESKYLRAIDLPVIDRNTVIQELRYMGITAGSMFPGLDGACEELKERNFDD